ncbi:hypothetical protein [Devosia sp. FKR38]|uniref:hypothetical protein n=1 Tax=Devosia sp. FKR38 TaxID=2562312 RepID=UPI0010C09CB4|nr:hypothetical protein [Devosia sp. FKR38]
MKPLLHIACLATLVLAMPTAEAAKIKVEGRTMVERLDRSTPEAVAKTFLDAYASSDYFAAYYALSLDARLGFSNALNSFNLGAVIPGATATDMPGSRVWGKDLQPNVLSQEILGDPALGFDDLMLAAERNGMLPFVIGTAEIGAPTALADGALVVPVHNSGGQPETLELHLIIMPDASWRIDRISWDGSDAPARPWGLAN